MDYEDKERAKMKKEDEDFNMAINNTNVEKSVPKF